VKPAAVAAPSAAEAAPAAAPPPPPLPPVKVSASDEKTIIEALDRQGFGNYNNYVLESDGTASLRALNTKSGQLYVIHVDKDGKITPAVSSGWITGRPQNN
jgi:hypothetical protein